MDTVFPFGFPRPTAAYLVWYVATLVIHVVFMNYVLAGSGYLAFVTMFTGGPGVSRQRTPIAAVLRDWMPFALSAAITAGVAPLLFLQILYKKAFYSANLLLFNRWMAILPVLIVGFYLLYLLKSRLIAGWPAWVRVVVGLGAFLCFAFTGLSWTENHLLSLNDSAWPGMYERGDLFYHAAALLPRFLMWGLGAIPTMALLVAWQLRVRQSRDETTDSAEVRRLGRLSLIGLAAAGLCALWYYAWLGAGSRAAVTGAMGRVYFGAAIVGVGLQAVAWLGLMRSARFTFGFLSLGSAGVLLTITGMAVVREAIRLSAIDITRLFEHHAAAARVGGMPVFLLFLVVNAVVIAACLWIVRPSRAV